MLKTALLVLSLTVSLAAQSPIRVLTPDDTRANGCNGAPGDFTSPFFTSARLELLAPGNFGAGGVVPRPVQLTTVPDLDLPALQGADIVLLTRVSKLDEDEIMLLNSFVLAGGGVLWFDNESAQSLQDFLGVTPGPSGINPPALIANQNSPIVNGPFGGLQSGTSVKHHFSGSFADVGRHGSVALTIGSEGFGVTFALGQGRVVAFTDEETFVSMGFSGCAAAAYGSNARLLFLNSIAHLAPPPGFAFTSQDVVLSSFGANCRNGANDTPHLTLHGEPTVGGYVRMTVTRALPGGTAVLLFGTARASTPFLGCTVLVGNILPVTAMVPLEDASGARPGSGGLEFQVNPGVTGQLVMQAVVLDSSAVNGLTWSRGADGRF